MSCHGPGIDMQLVSTLKGHHAALQLWKGHPCRSTDKQLASACRAACAAADLKGVWAVQQFLKTQHRHAASQPL